MVLGLGSFMYHGIGGQFTKHLGRNAVPTSSKSSFPFQETNIAS